MADLGDTIINGSLCVIGTFSTEVNLTENFCVQNNLFVCGCVINAGSIASWNLSGAGNHVHNNFDLLETYTISAVCINDTCSKAHTHSNLITLETINNTKLTDWDTAYTNSHIHSNKILLDSYTQDNDDIIDSITKMHNQNTDNALCSASPVAITTSGTSCIVQFKNNENVISTINVNGLYSGCVSWGCIVGAPTYSAACIDASITNFHSHTNLILLESYTNTNSDLSDAVTKKHEHTNSTILNAIDQDVYSGADVNFDILCSNNFYICGNYINDVIDNLGVIVVKSSVCTCCNLQLNDKGAHIMFASTCAIQVHIPTNASISFPLGSQIDFSQACSGQINFCGAGVTINSRFCDTKTNGLWSGASLLKTDVDTWFLIGDLTS